MSKANIKSSWSEVTIGEYKEFIKLAETFDESGKEPMDVLNYNLSLLSLFSDQDQKYYEELTQHEYIDCVNTLDFLNTMPPIGKVKKTYVLGGKKYDVTGTARKIGESSIRELKAIQYIDFLTVDKMKAEKGHIEMIDTELAILLLPKGVSYGTEGFSVSENAEYIAKHLSICDALAISAFFLLQYEALIVSTVNSLKRRLRKTIRKNPETMSELKTELRKLDNLRSPMDLCRNGVGGIIWEVLQRKTE